MSDLTLDEASGLVGDDIAYWLGNPFMAPELLSAKVCHWMTVARDAATTCPGCTEHHLTDQHAPGDPAPTTDGSAYVTPARP